jgi:hypothetical protein
MADWVTISSLATAGGTLVLAVATFASVRSANRSARIAEIAVMANLRPLLMPSRMDDARQKVGFMDEVWLQVDGGHAGARVTEQAVYLVVSVRNSGAGTALLHGWRLVPESVGPPNEPPAIDEFRRLNRDIYVAANDVGFWQGAFRDPEADDFARARRAIEERQDIYIDVLYGDLEGGQRTITRFGMRPAGDDAWLATAGRVWNVDRPASR